MKIGMLTFHRANNLGANLQAYALNKYINDNLGYCEIIDYFPNNQMAHRSKMRKILSGIKAILLFPLNSAERKYSEFQKKNYVLSKRKYYGDADLASYLPKYDVLISGSDQILNVTLSGISKSYYLVFADNVKKISYASSFGRTELTEIEYYLIEKELSKFSFLSVREKTAGELISQKIGVVPRMVLDPVFLLSKEEWKQKAVEVKVPSKYIFLYVMEINDWLLDVVEKMKERFNLPVVCVYGSKKTTVIKGVIERKCGPLEFIDYVGKSAFVITNSFHGTAFSIILEKKFVCISHSCRNTRLENIMELVEKNDKLIFETTDCSIIEDYIVDGIELAEKIIGHVEKSKKYLAEALEK